jgi:pentatricopeptide repeat protein
MRVVACALDSDVSVMNGLVVMYGKCGSMDDAVNTFEKVYDSSRETYVSILSACSHQVDLHEGRRIHGLVTKTGHETEVSVANALINIYSKCGSLQEAASVFEKMPEWNVASWTTMITSHAQHGHGEFALHLFDKMQSEGLLPNKVTFVNMLNAFSHAGMIDEGYHCLGYLNHGISSMSPIEDHYNCIIDLLARAGRLSEAENLIRQMPLTPSAISWTSFLNGCRQHLDVERGEYAAEIIFRMEPTNPAPYLTMYNLYIATGRLQDAANVMCKLRENSVLKHEVRQCVA